ncbi:MAG TPA: GNAT family N-acetyltransferase [Terriglobales bacterium]|jgi:RimJ/RimL family protein N-acetyltransferase|nr:GNAT family N-acetyltransferase [Terriglobales bacterium]
MLTIETPRLRLRDFIAEDADALARILSDPETMRYYPAPFDRQGVEDWIQRNLRRYSNDGFGLWAMILKESGELIGNCGLIKQTVDGIEEIEIGYHLRRDHWGRGLATEAARAVRDYGFATLGVDRLISLIRPQNIPSRRVAERNGMKLWKEVLWRDLEHCVYAVQRADVQPEGAGTAPAPRL